MTYKFATNYGRIGTARSANLQAYYKFDGDLTDSSGNSLTLSLAAGTTHWGKIGNLTGITLRSNKFESAASAGLNVDGAMTNHVLWCPEDVPSPEWKDLFLVHNPGVSTQYSLGIEAYTPRCRSDNPTTKKNLLTTFSPVVGVPILISLTRDSSDNINWYINGEDYGAGSLNPCTVSAAAANCEIMINPGRDCTGGLAELQIVNIELTAAQVLEDARTVMPWL